VREPEPDVVGRAQRGDPDAFEILVRTHLADAYRMAFHLVGDASTAEDVTQDAFLSAWRALPRFRGDAKFSTWLHRIVRNTAVESLRSAARRRRLAALHRPDDPVPDPSLRTAVRDAIDTLPDDLRETFVTVEVLGFTYPEAASILGVAIGTVRSRMHRTRRRLMAELREEDTGEV